MHALNFLAAFLALTSAATLSPRQSSTACNNSPDLCSKAYNGITHLGAHNSPFVRDASTDYSTSGNQYYNSTVQLSAGVRLLSAQVHESNGAWHLCHSSCDLLDAGTLSSWLSSIKSWLDNNPNEVVTILLVNSDNATPTQLAAEFDAAAITSYAYIPSSTTTPPTTWPTLQELITAQKRLLVFVASLDTASISSTESYLMDEFTFIFENPYDNTNVTEFVCTPDRPTAVSGDISAAVSSNRMPFTNHFLYESGFLDIEIPDVDDILTTNSPGNSAGNLGYSLNQCNTAYGRAPTFVLVDFFDQGPAIQAVDSINGVTNPVGRTTASSSTVQESRASRTTTSFRGVVSLATLVRAGQVPKLGAWVWAAGDWSWGGINLSGGDILG